MDVIQWNEKPQLSRPTLIAAFEGWNDAGNSASDAAAHIRDRWDATDFAELDPEEFYDFTTTRPIVRLSEDGDRRIEWPGNTFSWASIPGHGDVIVLVGHEPQLRWRLFCESIIEVARAFDAKMIVTLGALIADVPHTREVEIYGSGSDTKVCEELDLEQSTYEGPTGIVGALGAACREAAIPAVSLWGAVPSYVSSAPSPKVTLALANRLSRLLETDIPTTDLEIQTASYEKQVNELVAEDDDTVELVAELEARYDDLGRSEDLVEEVERFLRDQGST